MTSSATKRLSKSAVDWVKFSEMVPTEQKASFNAFKASSDGFARKVNQLPESLPQLDFSAYKSRLPGMSDMIDQFEKKYAAVDVSYPKDDKNVSSQIDEQRTKAESEAKAWISESNKRIDNYKLQLAKWELLPPIEHMMEQEKAIYFPDKPMADVFRKEEVVWPFHCKDTQDLARRQEDFRTLVKQRRWYGGGDH